MPRPHGIAYAIWSQTLAASKSSQQNFQNKLSFKASGPRRCGCFLGLLTVSKGQLY